MLAARYEDGDVIKHYDLAVEGLSHEAHTCHDLINGSTSVEASVHDHDLTVAEHTIERLPVLTVSSLHCRVR